MKEKYSKIIKHLRQIITSSLAMLFVIALLLLAVMNRNIQKDGATADLMGYGFISSELTTDQQMAQKEVLVYKILGDKKIDDVHINDAVIYYDAKLDKFKVSVVNSIYTNEMSEVFYVMMDSNDSTVYQANADEVLGTYQVSIDAFGNFLNYIQTPIGYGIVVCIPLAISFLIVGYLLNDYMTKYKRSMLSAKMVKEYNRLIRRFDKESKKIRESIMVHWIT